MINKQVCCVAYELKLWGGVWEHCADPLCAYDIAHGIKVAK